MTPSVHSLMVEAWKNALWLRHNAGIPRNMIPTAPQRNPAPHASAAVAAILTLAAAVAFATVFELSPIDDAYISLRYAANWASGVGLCFNPGERVEGYTNFLLIVIEALAVRAGADPETTIRVIGFASLTALAWGMTRFIARDVCPGMPVAAAALGVTVCLHPILACWAASGMETCLYTLLLWTAVVFALRSDTRRRAVLSAMFLTLAAMTRPEAAALIPVTTYIVQKRRGQARSAVCHAGCFVVAFGLYFSLRACHFGQPFPNTFYAKLDYGGVDLVKRGLHYVADFAHAAPTLTLPIAVAVLLIRRASDWVRAFALIAACHIAIIIYEGGDHFALFRFQAPMLPFLALLAAYPFVNACRRFDPHSRLRTTVVGLGIAAVALSGFTVANADKPNESPPTTHLARFQSECRCARDWSDLGRWFRRAAPPDASLATIAIGALGYHSGLTLIDPYGLIDPVIAHTDTPLGAGYAGHEKFDTDYVLSRRPAYILLVNLPTPGPARADKLHNVVWGAFNHAMIDNPRLAEHYAYKTIRLESGYLNLHVRRDLPTPAPARSRTP